MAGRAAKPLVVLDRAHGLFDWLGRIIPTALLVVDIVHVGALAGNAVALLARQAFRVLEVHARIGVAAIVIVLDGELVALEVLNHLRLFRQVGVALLRTAVPRR